MADERQQHFAEFREEPELPKVIDDAGYRALKRAHNNFTNYHYQNWYNNAMAYAAMVPPPAPAPYMYWAYPTTNWQQCPQQYPMMVYPMPYYTVAPHLAPWHNGHFLQQWSNSNQTNKQQ